jgi:hypothetical protein
MTFASIAGISLVIYLIAHLTQKREQYYTIIFNVLFVISFMVRIEPIANILSDVTGNFFASKLVAYEINFLAFFFALKSFGKAKKTSFLPAMIITTMLVVLFIRPFAMVIDGEPQYTNESFWRFALTDFVVFTVQSYLIYQIFRFTNSNYWQIVNQQKKTRWFFVRLAMGSLFTYTCLRAAASILIVFYGDLITGFSLSQSGYDLAHFYIRFFMIFAQLFWVVALLPAPIHFYLTDFIIKRIQKRQIEALQALIRVMPSNNMPTPIVHEPEDIIRSLVIRLWDIKRLTINMHLSGFQLEVLGKMKDVDDNQPLPIVVKKYVAIGSELERRSIRQISENFAFPNEIENPLR